MMRIQSTEPNKRGRDPVALLLIRVAHAIFNLAIPLFAFNMVESHSLKSGISSEVAMAAEELICLLILCRSVCFACTVLWLGQHLDRINVLVSHAMVCLAVTAGLLAIRFSVPTIVCFGCVSGWEQGVRYLMVHRLERRSLFKDLLLDALQPNRRSSVRISSSGLGRFIGYVSVGITIPFGFSAMFLLSICAIIIAAILLRSSETVERDCKPLAIDHAIPASTRFEILLHMISHMIPNLNGMIWIVISKEMFEISNAQIITSSIMIACFGVMSKAWNGKHPGGIMMSIIIFCRATTFAGIAHLNDQRAILFLASLDMVIRNLIDDDDGAIGTDACAARAIGEACGALALTYSFELGLDESFSRLTLFIAIGLLAAASGMHLMFAIFFEKDDDGNTTQTKEKASADAKTLNRHADGYFEDRPASPALSTVAEEDETARSRRGSVISAYSHDGQGRVFGNTIVEYDPILDKITNGSEISPRLSGIPAISPRLKDGMRVPNSREHTTRMGLRRSSDLSTPGRSGSNATWNTSPARPSTRNSNLASMTIPEAEAASILMSTPVVSLSASRRLKHFGTSESEPASFETSLSGFDTSPSAPHDDQGGPPRRFASSEEAWNAFSRTQTNIDPDQDT